MLQRFRTATRRKPLGLLICQALFIVVCIGVMLDGRHPPAQAQEIPGPVTPAAEVYGLEIRTAGIDKRIDKLESDIAEMKARQSKAWDSINAALNSISGMQGENRGIFGVLAALQAAGIVFVVRKKKSSGAEE